jgi:hypothetical protein
MLVNDWLISIVSHLNTLRPLTFFLSNLVLICTPEYAIKKSYASSGTPCTKKSWKLELTLTMFLYNFVSLLLFCVY